MCRNRLRKAKATLEQDLVRDKYTGQNRKAKESVLPLIYKKGELMITDMEKAEVINQSFPFSSQVVRLPISLKSLILGVSREAGREIPPTISKEQVQDHFMKLHSHKSIELGGILRKLADVVAKPLYLKSDKSCWSG